MTDYIYDLLRIIKPGAILIGDCIIFLGLCISTMMCLGFLLNTLYRIRRFFSFGNKSRRTRRNHR